MTVSNLEQPPSLSSKQSNTLHFYDENNKASKIRGFKIFQSHAFL